jgi:hypothetical protein
MARTAAARGGAGKRAVAQRHLPEACVQAIEELTNEWEKDNEAPAN